MPIRVAINGFGRIGRAAYKILATKSTVEVVAINDLTDAKTLAHLLKYDTAYGKYDREITFDDTSLTINGKKVLHLLEKEPAKLPWKKLNIDVVLECTGRFVDNGASKAHLEAGAKRVVVSAPTKGDDSIQTFLKGVNSEKYADQKIISNASCTTNCISPVISVMHAKLGIKKADMTTVHAVTADQNLVDGPHKDLRRARAAEHNIVPTTTGAAIATTEAFPDLVGKFDGLAIRVPVIVGSISVLTMLVQRPTTIQEVNNFFIEAAKTPFYAGVLEVTTEPLVSSDIVGTTASSIVDLSLTNVIDGDLVKVLAWYDNEWGYANRLVEMALHIASADSAQPLL